MFVYAVILLFLVIFYFYRKMPSKRVCVVVLGDIGRSPRMQYHSLSLSENGFEVDVIGYGGSDAHPDIVCNDHIHLCNMPQPPQFLYGLPRPLLYLSKVVWQAFFLLCAMMLKPKPSHILLQNPPAVPTMAICFLMARLRGSTFLIDWHNYGYSILALSLRSNHPVVSFARKLERWFGRTADRNLCVTQAMKEDLAKNWGIRADVVYDRSAAIFQTEDVNRTHKLFMKLSHQYEVFQHKSASVEHTAFTRRSRGVVQKLKDRPALLVSSTSWTKDEDFSLLLHALQSYEQHKVSGNSDDLPDLVCVITGKGPEKAYYQSLVAEKTWKYVSVCTPWLEAEDYPLLIGSADLGVCLHMSSSGLDLPMKVVDMFGCGLPVCAVHFNCLDELVKHEHNGLVFHDQDVLAEQIQQLLSGFPENCEKLQHFRGNLTEFQNIRWSDSWSKCVLPLLENTE